MPFPGQYLKAPAHRCRECKVELYQEVPGCGFQGLCLDWQTSGSARLLCQVRHQGWQNLGILPDTDQQRQQASRPSGCAGLLKDRTGQRACGSRVEHQGC